MYGLFMRPMLFGRDERDDGIWAGPAIMALGGARRWVAGGTKLPLPRWCKEDGADGVDPRRMACAMQNNNNNKKARVSWVTFHET